MAVCCFVCFENTCFFLLIQIFSVFSLSTSDQESVHKPEKTTAECVTDDEWFQFQEHHNSMQIASSSIMLQDSVEEQHRRRRTCLSQLAKSINITNWNDNSQHDQPLPTSSYSKLDEDLDQGNYSDGALTLELFPLRSSVALDLIKDDDGNNDIEDKDQTHLTSYQFFEFLPLKNSTAY